MVDIDFIVDELKKSPVEKAKEDKKQEKELKGAEKGSEQKEQKKTITKTVVNTEQITELVKEPVKKVKKRRIKKAHKPVFPRKETKQAKNLHKKTKSIGEGIKGSITASKLMKEMQELKHQMKDLTKLFSTAAEEMKKPDPFAEKLAEISEQNERIAEALLAVADIVKESKKELEDIEVPLSELPDFKFSQEEPPIPKPPEYMQDTPPNAYPQTMPYLPPGELQEELEPLNFRPGRQSSASQPMSEKSDRIPLKPIKPNIPPPPLRAA